MSSDMNTQDKDLVVNAMNAGNLNTLSNALKAAGLVSTFKGMGPFTMFAPTDAAFDKLPKGALEALLKDKQKLADLINAHVMAGAVLAKDMKSSEARSMHGEALRIAAADGRFTVNGAKASRDEIEASNGVIHPIDTVMLARH
ncbi:MAG TPA: fasciclin domain-containing protein [Usitatibacter sp.]|nr:fasciclin domain-containing protein [Usitatibacter sp.]